MRDRNTESNYSLKELCREAQVTERTVRYYIQEGLLPPPEGAGPFAHYNQHHLRRLRLIRRLKEEYLPLAEIRRRLDVLDPRDLETLTEQVFGKGEYDEEEADAKKYLDRLLNKAQAAPDNYSELPKKSSSDSPSWPAPPASSATQVSAPTPGAKSGNYNLAESRAAPLLQTESEVWQRVTLAPGVELNYQLRDQPQRDQINRLLEQAQQIFTDK